MKRLHRQPDAARPGATLAWAALAVILVLSAAARARLLDIPLERDEGEYAYIGQLLLQGVPPYESAYTMKLPGTALAYAFFMAIFGKTVQGVHLGLLVVNCASVALVFLIGRRLYDSAAGAAAAAVFAVLSLNHSVLGFAAHATQFVVLAALAGSLALLVALENGRSGPLLGAGILLGLAPVMKQPGALFVLFGGLYLVHHRRSGAGGRTVRDLALFSAGALVPLCLVVVWCLAAGSFDRFWFWTVTYAREYGAMVPWSEAASRFAAALSDVADGFALLWCAAAVGFLAAMASPRRPEQRAFLLLLAACGFAALCPGLYFRQHYFVTLLPAVALAAGYLVHLLWSNGTTLLRWAAASLFALALGSGIFLERAYFFETEPVALSRRFFSYNPFPESVEIAKYIRANSAPDDRIAVFGSEPQIYFYSGRRSATGHLYMYGMMEDHRYNRTLRDEFVREVEAARPRFIVFTPISGSWLLTERSDRSVISWLSDYQKKHYTLVGVAEMLSERETVYKWRDEARSHAFRTPRRVYVMERNDDG